MADSQMTNRTLQTTEPQQKIANIKDRNIAKNIKQQAFKYETETAKNSKQQTVIYKRQKHSKN